MKHKTRPIKLLEDEFGTYIPICEYKRHPGIAIQWRRCERKGCKHYRKYRAESPTRRYDGN